MLNIIILCKECNSFNDFPSVVLGILYISWGLNLIRALKLFYFNQWKLADFHRKLFLHTYLQIDNENLVLITKKFYTIRKKIV